MTRVRIGTFNVEDLGSAAPKALSAERIAALRPLLREVAADVLCLQEVNAQADREHGGRTLTALDELLEGTPYASYCRVCSLGAASNHPADKHNLVVLSRWPIITHREVRHEVLPPLSYCPVTARPPTAAPMSLSFDRPLLYAMVALPSRRHLHVVNLHLKAPLAAPVSGQKESALVWKTVRGWAEGFFMAAQKRAAQALEARLFVDQIFDIEADALIAVCGDFNAEACETPVRLLRGDPDDTGSRALGSRVLTAADDRIPVPHRHSVVHAGRKVMLDHLLVSPALADSCVLARALNDAVADEALSFAAGVRVVGSFHAPVIAEFELRHGA